MPPSERKNGLKHLFVPVQPTIKVNRGPCVLKTSSLYFDSFNKAKDARSFQPIR